MFAFVFYKAVFDLLQPNFSTGRNTPLLVILLLALLLQKNVITVKAVQDFCCHLQHD